MAYNTDRADAHRTGKNEIILCMNEHLDILWAIYNDCKTYVSYVS